MSSSVTKQLACAVFVAGLFLNLTDGANAQRQIERVAQGSGTRIPMDQVLPSVGLPVPSLEGEIVGDSIPLIDDFVPDSVMGSAAPFEGTPVIQEPMPLADDGYLMDYDATFGGDEEAPVFSTNTWFRRGSWYSEMDVVVLTHDTNRINTVGFVIIDRTVRGIIGRTSNDLIIHQFETGARLTLGRFMGRDTSGREHEIEVSYLGGFDWTERISLQSQSANGFDVLSSNMPAFLNTNNVDYTYSAELNSYELNYRIQTRPGRDQLAMQPNGKWVRHGVGSSMRSVIAGFRGLSYRELVGIDAVNADQTQVGRYIVRTHNDMFGFQFGASIREKFDGFTWGVAGKVGGLLNFADRLDSVDTATADTATEPTAVVLLTDLDQSTDNVEDAEKLTFLAEIDLSGSYQIRPNLHFRASYKFLFLSGISAAPEQLSLTGNFPELNVGATNFLHGGSIGFETTW